MKRAALAMLAPLAGCNWVFGLEPTHAAPDAPDAPPPGVLVHVALLVETVAANGAPEAPVEAAIPDFARLEAGTLDGKPTVMLTASADGTTSVPMAIATAPAWRLIYQRQGGVIREYQNLPAEAHVIEPLLGPVTRTPPAVGSGYVITPTGWTGSHSLNRVYTTGAWTEGTKALAPAGATLDYDLVSAASLSGGLATPKPGDRGVLLDYVIDGATSCIRSTGTTDFEAGMPGPPKAPVMGPWLANAESPTILTQLALISTGDVAPFGEPSRAAREQFGYAAAIDMPLFMRTPDPNRSLLLPNPPMVLLRACPLPVGTTPPTLVVPIWMRDHFRPIVHTEISAARSISGATLVNGLAILTQISGSQFNVATSVAFPTAVKLGSADLFGASDGVAVTRGSTPIELTWQKTRASDVAHFWEVAVVKLPAGVPERVYVTTKPSVTIQPADLSAGEHVLEFTAYAGRSSAANGDFRSISGDQSISIIHSRTFVVQ